MTDREQLLDELARCYARAAIDALLRETDVETPPSPARNNGGVRMMNDEDHTRTRTSNAAT